MKWTRMMFALSTAVLASCAAETGEYRTPERAKKVLIIDFCADFLKPLRVDKSYHLHSEQIEERFGFYPKEPWPITTFDYDWSLDNVNAMFNTDVVEVADKLYSKIAESCLFYFEGFDGIETLFEYDDITPRFPWLFWSRDGSPVGRYPELKHGLDEFTGPSSRVLGYWREDIGKIVFLSYST